MNCAGLNDDFQKQFEKTKEETAEEAKGKITPAEDLHYPRVYHDFARRLTGTAWTYGYPGTSGTFFSNFLGYIRNQHVIISIFYCNPIAPFSREERLLFFFCNFSFLLMLSGLMDILDWEENLESLMVAGLTIPFSMILRYLLECPCLHTDEYTKIAKRKKSSPSCFNKNCFELYLEKTGSVVGMVMGAMSIGFLVYGLLLAIDIGPLFYKPFLTSQGMAYFGTQPIQLFVQFMYGWFICKHGDIFHKRWDHLFPKESPPQSFSDLAAGTEKHHGEATIKHHKHFVNWKHYFDLPNKNPWVDLTDDDEDYLTTV